MFTAEILHKYMVPYHYCAACDHLFVSNPTWMEEAYSDAIVQEDTDIAARNIFNALKLAAIDFLVLGDRDGASTSMWQVAMAC